MLQYMSVKFDQEELGGITDTILAMRRSSFGVLASGLGYDFVSSLLSVLLK